MVIAFSLGAEQRTKETDKRPAPGLPVFGGTPIVCLQQAFMPPTVSSLIREKCLPQSEICFLLFVFSYLAYVAYFIFVAYFPYCLIWLFGLFGLFTQRRAPSTQHPAPNTQHPAPLAQEIGGAPDQLPTPNTLPRQPTLLPAVAARNSSRSVDGQKQAINSKNGSGVLQVKYSEHEQDRPRQP